MSFPPRLFIILGIFVLASVAGRWAISGPDMGLVGCSVIGVVEIAYGIMLWRAARH